MRTLSLRQLKAVEAIMREGSVARAAKALSLTAPAVTLQLKQIEDDAGLPLFDRTRDGMRPTDAGRLVFEAATFVDERLRQLDEELDALKGVRAGHLRLGAVSTAKYFAPALMAGFKKAHPGIEISLMVGNREETVSALRDHRIDTALMGRPPKTFAVRAALFGDHPLVIVASAGHRLAGCRDILKETIAAEHFLVREPGSGTRISLEIFLSDIPGRLDYLGQEMGSNETIKQAVMADLGIAFISAHTIAQEVELGRLVILDVVGMPIRRQWYAVSHGDRTFSPAMHAFDTFLGSEGARYLPLVSKPYPAAAFGLS
ncbi:LysR family transcriptional regulator [Pararhizobium haloflavum]|uniref:LysR family transcriptional regulator n=1 Tax=Pararhizobium haloflavum TaxID=2037914 RepID=UPI000C191D4D|nr:LysR family transcriptional regulator [Pararhizobium haloflavum]